MSRNLRAIVGRVLPGPWVRGGVAGLALLAFVLSLATAAAPVPAPKPDKKDDSKKEEPKKEEPKKGADAQPDPPAPPPGGDADAFRRYQEEARRALQRAQNLRFAAPFGPYARAGEGRLGVYADKPGDALAEQLDLPRGQGLVVEQVQADSAAAKAGLRPHDILLEFAGKPVPDDVREFARQLQDVKADTAVDAVVLRKGKRETIKGVKLPEARAAAGELGIFVQPFPAMPALPALPNVPVLGGGGGGVLLTTFRTGDRFTTRYQEGTLVITVTGTVADGKAKPGEIQVQDGGKAEKYESADKVPEQYRDKVKSLIETSEKSSARIEIKSP